MKKSELNILYPPVENKNGVFVVSFKHTGIIPILDDYNTVIDYEINGFELVATPQENYECYLSPILQPNENTFLSINNLLNGYDGNIDIKLIDGIYLIKYNIDSTYSTNNIITILPEQFRPSKDVILENITISTDGVVLNISNNVFIEETTYYSM